MATLTPQEKRDIALTIAGEIDPRYSPYGKDATRTEIANILATIENRYSINQPKAFGRANRNTYSSRSDVVRQPSQYSTWNDRKGRATAKTHLDNHRSTIEAAVDDYYSGKLAPKMPEATHYWAPKAMKTMTGKPDPYWAGRVQDHTRVGAHKFAVNKSLWNGRHQPRSAPVTEVKRSNLTPITGAPVPYSADRARAQRGKAGFAGPLGSPRAAGLLDRRASPFAGPLGSPRASGLLGGPVPATTPYGLPGNFPTPTPRSSVPGRRGLPSPTYRDSIPGRPGIPTPTARPDRQRANFAGPAGSFRSQQAGFRDLPDSVRDRMAPQPASLPASVMDRMRGFPDTPSIPDLPAAARMISSTAPGVQTAPMTRADANLPAGVMERMAGFGSVPTPTARPSMIDRAAGLLGMDAKAATIPGAARLSPDARIAQARQHGAQGSWGPVGATGSWAPAPTARPNFAGPMGSPRAAGVPDYQAPAPTSRPSYQAPPASYQTPAFSTQAPMIDALGQPPIPGLQRARAPQAAPPSYPAPREIAPAPRIAGPVGQTRQDQQPQQGNIPTEDAATRETRAMAAAAANMNAASRPTGMFSGGFSGPAGVMGGAMLGGALAGLPGVALGGLLGSQTVRDKLGIGGWGQPQAFGNGVTTGLLTGMAIPREITQRYGAESLYGGFTGLGLPDFPGMPSYNPNLYDGGGGHGTVSQGARDSINSGRAGGGLF